MEIWKDVKGYEGKYQVSNTGKVRSLSYNNSHFIKELEPKINKYGYKEVTLSKNNKRKHFLVSTLVGKTFLKNNNFKETIFFKNKNKNDCSVNNLKFGYYSERNHNMYNKGSRKIGKPTFTKITINKKNYKNYEEIRKEYKINKSTFEKRFYVYGWNIYETIEVPIGRR